MKTLTAAALQELRTEHPSMPVINVLEPAAFDQAHIPGSINIPVSRPDFVERVRRATVGVDQTIVVYCASKACQASPKAARALEDAGFTSVYDFEGGLEEWDTAGYELASHASRR